MNKEGSPWNPNRIKGFKEAERELQEERAEQKKKEQREQLEETKNSLVNDVLHEVHHKLKTVSGIEYTIYPFVGTFSLELRKGEADILRKCVTAVVDAHNEKLQEQGMDLYVIQHEYPPGIIKVEVRSGLDRDKEE